MAVIYIVILIGVLVFVHEFGHYIAARLFKVKVLSFSIGFGPKIASIKRGDTSWDIRILPLGGFVQMYGTEFEEVNDKNAPDFDRAYNNKPIWQKAIINLAGPLFNLILPLPILFGVYAATITNDMPAQIGQVLDNSPALGVLEPGDLVTHINGDEVRFWTQMSEEIRANAGNELDFTIIRDGKSLNVKVTPEDTTLRDAMDIKSEQIGRIGITPDFAPSVIGLTVPESDDFALKTFDEITSVNGQPVRNYVELEQALRKNTQDTLNLTVLRPVEIPVEYGSISKLTTLDLTINRAITSADELGIAPSNMYLASVDDDSPASRAGLQKGDRILEIDGKSINVFRSFIDKLTVNWEDPHELTVLRNGESFKTKIQLEKLTITGEFQEERPIIYAGFYNKTPVIAPELLDKTMSERLSFAAVTSVKTTAKASTLLVYSIVRMFQGRVSTKSLGGPILIGHMASKAGESGIDIFLKMLALISINLGIVNLVPIPLLDGGKLAILGVEAIKRGPISMRTRQIIAYIGLAMVALLLMLAFKNDLERMWNLFFS